MIDMHRVSPSPNAAADRERELERSVRELADLLADQAQWIEGFFSLPSVRRLMRGDDLDYASASEDRLHLMAIRIGAQRIAERLG